MIVGAWLASLAFVSQAVFYVSSLSFTPRVWPLQEMPKGSKWVWLVQAILMGAAAASFGDEFDYYVLNIVTSIIAASVFIANQTLHLDSLELTKSRGTSLQMMMFVAEIAKIWDLSHTSRVTFYDYLPFGLAMILMCVLYCVYTNWPSRVQLIDLENGEQYVSEQNQVHSPMPELVLPPVSPAPFGPAPVDPPQRLEPSGLAPLLEEEAFENESNDTNMRDQLDLTESGVGNDSIEVGSSLLDPRPTYAAAAKHAAESDHTEDQVSDYSSSQGVAVSSNNDASDRVSTADPAPTKVSGLRRFSKRIGTTSLKGESSIFKKKT